MDIILRLLRGVGLACIAIVGWLMLQFPLNVGIGIAVCVGLLYAFSVFTFQARMLSIVLLLWGILVHFAGIATPVDVYRMAMRQLPQRQDALRSNVAGGDGNVRLSSQVEQLADACGKELLTPEECKNARVKILENFGVK